MVEERPAPSGVSDALRRAAPPSWDFPRNAISARGIVEVACDRGMNESAVLSGSGLAPSDLHDPTVEVESGQELAVIRNVVNETRAGAELGAHAGARGPLRMLGFLGFAMVSSRTARDAIAIADRLGYGKVAPLFLRPRVLEDSTGLTILFEEEEVPEDVRVFLTGRDISHCLAMLPVMFGETPPAKVSTTLSGEDGRGLASALSRWPVQTGAANNAIRFDNATLARPLPNADERTLRICERDIEEVLERRRQRSSVVPQVRSAMLRERATIPSLVNLAKEQHVDPRTLRRQLAAEGTSFRELANGVRETLAVELLAKGQTVQQVADRLGYCDAATFSRAFKRWTGRTPGSVTRKAPTYARNASGALA